MATELSIGAAADSAMASYSPSFDFSGMIDSAAPMQFDIAPATAAARGDVAMLNAMQTRGAADNIATLAGYTNGGTPVWDYQDIPEIMVESPNVAAPQQRAYLPGLDQNLMRNSLVGLAKVNAFSAGAGLLGLGGALSALGRGTVQVARNYLTMSPAAATIASTPELTTAAILAAEAVTPGASGAGASALGIATLGSAGYLDELTQVLGRIEPRFAEKAREIGFILDSSTGSILASRRASIADPMGFSLSSSDMALLKGNVFTHNHPGGGSFSVGDMSTALGSGAAEFRAVTSDRIYSLSFDRSVAGIPDSPAGAVYFMQNEQRAIGTGYRADVASGALVPPSGPSRGVWQSQYFMEQFAARNPWAVYSAAPR